MYSPAPLLKVILILKIRVFSELYHVLPVRHYYYCFLFLFFLFVSAPSVVQNVIINITETTAYMKWQEPKNPNGKIQYYSLTLFYNNSPSVIGNSTEKSFIFENLEPYQNYSVSIIAVNSMPGEKYAKNFRTKIDGKLLYFLIILFIYEKCNL